MNTLAIDIIAQYLAAKTPNLTIELTEWQAIKIRRHYPSGWASFRTRLTITVTNNKWRITGPDIQSITLPPLEDPKFITEIDKTISRWQYADQVG